MAPIPTPRLPLWLRALHSSARYTATASVRGLLVAEIQVLVPYRIHPSIHPIIEHHLIHTFTSTRKERRRAVKDNSLSLNLLEYIYIYTCV